MFIILAAAKTFNSDFCRQVMNALYQRWVELFAHFSTSVKNMSKCCLNVLLEAVIYISFYLMVNQWMANMWLLFETKQQQEIVLWWLSHEFDVAMYDLHANLCSCIWF